METAPQSAYPAVPPAYAYPGPQQYPQPAAGQAPYVIPTAGYPSQPGLGAPQYVEQQQQPMVVQVQQQPVPVLVQVQSFAGHIAFACIVFWCCNWLFGLIAFILAMQANGSAASDPSGARKLGNVSIGVSVAGIIVSVIIIIIVVAVAFGEAASSCRYTYNGVCYRYKDYVGPSGYCFGVKSFNDYCYHN